MAARFNVEQVIQLVQREDSDEEQSIEIESLEDVNDDKEKLSTLLDSFDGGETFNQSFFKDNAIRVLMPLVQMTRTLEDSVEQPQRCKGIFILYTFILSNSLKKAFIYSICF